VIERIAYRLGIVPRALRNAAWIVPVSCAVAAICVLVDSSQYSAMILVLLLAFPFRMRPSTRAWLPQGGTEWMLASGAWTRAMLARSTIFEILLLASGGAGALAVIAKAHAIDAPDGIARSFIFFGFAVVSFQGFTAVIANWNSSTRLPARAHLPQIRNQEIASPLRIAFLIAWIVAVQTLAAVKGRPMWVVPTGALMLIVTYWLVSGAEISAGSEGRERSDKRRETVSAKPFGVWHGLLWHGLRPSTRVVVVCAPFLPLTSSIVRVFGRHVDFAVLGGLSTLMLLWIAQRPFRWESEGPRSEFLCTAGIPLRDARRIELVTGLFLGLEMLAVGLINTPAAGQGREWLIHGMFFGLILLASNRARIPNVLGRAMRVYRLLPWSVLAAVLLGLIFVFVDRIAGREPQVMNIGMLVALLAITIATPIGLWIWAFLRAGSDERLRLNELEPKLDPVTRR
jgi:hypothetical protein